MSTKRPWIIIGTSGSHDYLREGAGSKRFWPVVIPLALTDGTNGRGDLSTDEHDESGKARQDDPKKMEY